MSNNNQLVPTSGMRGFVERNDQKGLGRDLSRTERCRALAQARVEAHADVQALRSDAQVYVGKNAMLGMAEVAQLQDQLTQAYPEAEAEFRRIAAITGLGVTQTVVDTGWFLR